MKLRLLSALTAMILPACALMAQNYELSTPSTTLLISNSGGTARIVYYGPKVDGGASAVDGMRAAKMTFDRESYPAFGVRSENERAIAVTQPDGSMTLDLKVESVKKTSDGNGSILQIDMKDKVYPFYVRQYFKAWNGTDIISTWTDLINSAKKPMALELFASAQIPIMRSDNYVTHFHGSWGAENFMSEEKLSNGQVVIANKEGVRNTHYDNPSVMVSVEGKATENSGTVFGGALAWSGNYKIKVHAQNNSLEVLAGINEETSRYILDGGKTFTTPEFAMTYSTEGKGGVSRAFHRWARKYAIAHGDQERMVLLNSWEGVYLNVSEPTMVQMMEDIASLGGELFVMDDGWFGDKWARNTDDRGLGDWMVNKKKLPNGIKGLTDAAKQKGVKFGIWIEPEMINAKKSELYEKHPDWVLSSDKRPLATNRGGSQMVLDLTNPKVQDYVFTIFDNIMTQAPDVAYIKWDANAPITNYSSHYLKPDRQSQIYIDYQLGMRNVLKRIRAKYPDVIIQACASGGGRVNYGYLPYFDEYWTSDCSDAYQRLFIQWGCSHFYPAIGMAAHVSPSPNHQTGRATPLKFRFDVAMQGRLGMELQPKDMKDNEKEFAKRAIAAYKDIRPVVQMGDQYRLNSPYDDDHVTAMMYASEDKSKCAFFVYRDRKILAIENEPVIRLDGVDPDKNYKFTDLDPVDPKKPQQLNGKIVSGRALKYSGVRVHLNGDYSSAAFKLEAQ